MRYFIGLLVLLSPLAASAQSLDLTVGNTGISIGDSREVNGIRLNYRDRRLRRVNGINATIWMPYDSPQGEVSGLALGLPATGARSISGLSIGAIGVGADESLSGIIVGGVGAGAGGDVSGIAIGGLGVGAGGSANGIFVGGLGAGAGEDVTGFGIGGLGAGAGQDVSGLFIGGLGVGAGENATGILIGGLGAGAGRDVTGIVIGGLGSGAGGTFKGISISGLGAGAGERLEGVHIAGLGVGAPVVRGLILAAAAGGKDVAGAIIAPAYFKVEWDGRFRGVSVSAFNRILGEQNGLTIGILNWAEHLNGLQIGVLNFAGNQRRGLRWLPILNYHRD